MTWNPAKQTASQAVWPTRMKNARSGVTPERALFILVGQAAWLAVCFAGFQVIWRRGVRAYSAVGA